METLATSFWVRRVVTDTENRQRKMKNMNKADRQSKEAIGLKISQMLYFLPLKQVFMATK